MQWRKSWWRKMKCRWHISGVYRLWWREKLEGKKRGKREIGAEECGWLSAILCPRIEECFCKIRKGRIGISKVWSTPAISLARNRTTIGEKEKWQYEGIRFLTLHHLLPPFPTSLLIETEERVLSPSIYFLLSSNPSIQRACKTSSLVINFGAVLPPFLEKCLRWSEIPKIPSP